MDLFAIDSIAQCKLNIHRSSYENAAFNRNRQDVDAAEWLRRQT